MWPKMTPENRAMVQKLDSEKRGCPFCGGWFQKGETRQPFQFCPACEGTYEGAIKAEKMAYKSLSVLYRHAKKSDDQDIARYAIERLEEFILDLAPGLTRSDFRSSIRELRTSFNLLTKDDHDES